MGSPCSLVLKTGVYAHNLVCVHECADYAHAYGGMHDIMTPLVALPLIYFCNRVSHWTWSSPFWQDWLFSQTPGSLCLCFPMLVLQVWAAKPSFMWALELKLRVPWLHFMDCAISQPSHIWSWWPEWGSDFLELDKSWQNSPLFREIYESEKQVYIRYLFIAVIRHCDQCNL